ncbi:MAG: hypothetical protein EXS02_01850 [Planctomycetes bacterium]|nr:hypothetical protein [Planctomycetota bacterium]
MIALVLTLMSLLQDPKPNAARMAIDAVAVIGTPELDVASAFQAAQQQVHAQMQERWLMRAKPLIAEMSPFWVPTMLAEKTILQWGQSEQAMTGMCVVDREDRRREHEFGSSFQTTLWVREEPLQITKGEGQLRSALSRLNHRLLMTSGGTVVFWAMLAMGIGWLDRLSRGYMTGRLQMAGLLLGSTIPALAFAL